MLDGDFLWVHDQFPKIHQGNIQSFALAKTSYWFLKFQSFKHVAAHSLTAKILNITLKSWICRQRLCFSAWLKNRVFRVREIEIQWHNSKKTPKTDPENTGSKRKAIFLVFFGSFEWIFSEIKRG